MPKEQQGSKPEPSVLWCPICRKKPIKVQRLWDGRRIWCCEDCNLMNDGT